MSQITLKMESVNKSFSGIKVLKNVSFEAVAGEVHSLIGENGAGKSVLMKTLTGALHPDSGYYHVVGRDVKFLSPAEAYRGGVSMVYQTLSLIPSLSVTENVLVGRLPVRKGRILWSEAHKEVEKYLGMIEAYHISPKSYVSDLRVAEKQEVEIAKALSFHPSVLVLDEPSTALPRAELQHLYKRIRLLREQGLSVIYISHKLEEIFDLADRVTVIRDGQIVGTFSIEELTPASLIEKITGREISMTVSKVDKGLKQGRPVLELRDFEAHGLFSGVNLTVAEGEIVGITGLVGAGKTEVGKAIFGALTQQNLVNGTYRFEGKKVKVKSLTPQKAKNMGVGMLTEDRQKEGLIAEQTVIFHITLLAFHRVARGLYIMGNRAKKLVWDVINSVAIRPPDPYKQAQYFSGGNQQKLVLGKWLAAEAKLLILDEPTQGVDVGAREEIYKLIRQLAEQGNAVLVISSDLREIMALSHRVIIMRLGQVTGEVWTHDVSEEDLLNRVLGIGEDNGNKPK